MQCAGSRFFALPLAAFAVFAPAQTGPHHFPAGVVHARTIAIVNDTHTPQVEKGADEALAVWGQFKVVDDPQLAEITLHFDKAHHHEGHDSQTVDPNGKDASYGYGMSFGSSIEMKAFFKDEDKPFYTTTTNDGKAKAGSGCINSFHTAFREALGEQAGRQ